MVILAVSDVVWQALIGAFVTVILAGMQLWSKRSADRAAAAAAVAARGVAMHAAEVKTALAESDAERAEILGGIADLGQKTHALVNSAMLEQKKLYLAKCEEAQRQNPSPANEAEYRAARQAYEEHRAKQERMEQHPP